MWEENQLRAILSTCFERQFFDGSVKIRGIVKGSFASRRVIGKHSVVEFYIKSLPVFLKIPRGFKLISISVSIQSPDGRVNALCCRGFQKLNYFTIIAYFLGSFQYKVTWLMRTAFQLFTWRTKSESDEIKDFSWIWWLLFRKNIHEKKNSMTDAWIPFPPPSVQYYNQSIS